MRCTVLALLLVLAPGFAAPRPEYVQAVEFPYYLYPRGQWERELVWLKTVGVRTVEFSIPWSWHQLQPGEFDFTGRTSPRRDLVGFIRVLRKLELRGWIRPLPPVAGLADNGWPAGMDARAQMTWVKQLEDLLAPQTERHGGPIAFVEGHELAVDAGPPPAPVITISAGDPSALTRSREAIAARRGALLWREIEAALYPAGWEPAGSSLLRKGAVDLSGNEQSAAEPLRRDAALLRNWAGIVPLLRPIPKSQTQAMKLPKNITATELVSRIASAVSVTNRGESTFHGDLRVRDAASERTLVIPAVSVAGGESLWLPFNLSLSSGGLCRECSNFSASERIVYATAELLAVEFENGILAMEFASPQPGEVVLQLAREPVGPLLAAGKPTKFDWDPKTLRARLPIPAGSGAGSRVRIGLAIEPPETSAFFADAKRLTIGQKNSISTVYSSPEVAARSRLRVPEGFAATASTKSPNEIEYTINVPADALHGDFAPLTIEADGVALGRARLQLFRPASIRLLQAIQLHFGALERLTTEPFTAPVDLRGGSNLEFIIRNNSPDIQTYRLEAAGDNLEFSPAKTEITVAAMEERPVVLRVFAKKGATGVCEWHLRVTGGADMDLPFRALLLPRGGTVAWTADLDGDGSPEWVLESQKVRAVFSSRDGGRWMEFTWKDTGANFLPSDSAFAQPGPVEVRPDGGTLQFIGNGWTRTVSLTDTKLSIEQTSALPGDSMTSRTSGNITLSVDRQSPLRVVYELRQTDAGP